jgi:hypothetical protein
MLKNSFLQKLFVLCLFIALLVSFYFFIDVLVFKKKDHSTIFSTWQFPMLLAIFVDTIYGL